LSLYKPGGPAPSREPVVVPLGLARLSLRKREFQLLHGCRLSFRKPGESATHGFLVELGGSGAHEVVSRLSVVV
jgi:hypothetical protein